MSFHHTAIGMIIASQAVDIHTTCIVIELIPWKKKDNSHNALFSFCDFSQGEKTSLASKLTHSLPWQLKVGFLFRFFFLLPPNFSLALAGWGGNFCPKRILSKIYFSFFSSFYVLFQAGEDFFYSRREKMKKGSLQRHLPEKGYNINIYIYI